MSTTSPDPTTVVGAPSSPTPPVPDVYTVNRTQDGAQVRAELSLKQAQEECAILNGQSRTQVGLTAPVYDRRGVLMRSSAAIFGSMFQGEICRYEVRSTATGLVIA